MTRPLRVTAPAKLNLDLRVVGQRDDGYHELESTLVLIDLADRLLLLPGATGLRVEGADAGDVPLDETNLAWRGLVAGYDGEPDLVCLALEKRVPAAAGLGGGSSDAAAAWRLGRAARGLDERPTPTDLADLAAIGADVPFFASGAAAGRVTGIGEAIEPLQPVTAEVVLVHPPFTLATADVFAELRPDDWGAGANDLEAPARRLRPELDDLFGRMRAAGAEPRLTGSGSTIFALDDDPERADALARRLAGEALRVTRTRTRTAPTAIEFVDDASDDDQEDR